MPGNSRVTDMFTISIVIVISWVYTEVEAYQIIHFEYMQSVVCQVYPNKVVSQSGLTLKKRWEKGKCLSLSERSQSEKAVCCMIRTV